MLWLILAFLVVLVALVAYLVLRTGAADYTDRIESLLKERFLDFQSEIHKQMDSTRQEVTRSKDIISEHTIKTIDTVREMGTTISRIIQQQEETQKLGQSLKDILQAPKLRGSYGETILEEMLERVLPRSIFEVQYEIESGRRVDAVIKVRDVIIPIDAKFPRDSYLRYLEAEAKEEKEKHWKDHETAVRNQIKSIKAKYVKPEKGTADFALMFIPSESVYYETIAEKNYMGDPSSLYEECLHNQIIPVSPNTFYAFLQVVMMGIKNLEMVNKAKEIKESLKALERDFTLFYSKYEEMGKSVEKAVEAFRVGDGHVGRYRKKLENTLNLENFNDTEEELEE